jgi:hypothetical protein
MFQNLMVMEWSKAGAKHRGSLILSINSPEAFWNPSLVRRGRHPEVGDSTTPAGHFPVTASREDSVSAPACGSRSGRINVRVARHPPEAPQIQTFGPERGDNFRMRHPGVDRQR